MATERFKALKTETNLDEVWLCDMPKCSDVAEFEDTHRDRLVCVKHKTQLEEEENEEKSAERIKEDNYDAYSDHMYEQEKDRRLFGGL